MHNKFLGLLLAILLPIASTAAATPTDSTAREPAMVVAAAADKTDTTKAATAATTTRRLSLEEAVALGLANSSSIKSKNLAVSKARADLQEARSYYFPTLSAGATWTHRFEENEPTLGVYTVPRDPVSLKLDLSQTLYTFGKTRQGVRLAEEQLKQKELDLAEEKRSLTNRIQRAFYGYILAQEALTINRQTLESKQEALSVARQKFSAGISSDFEVLQAEVDVEAFKPTVISAQNSVKITLLTVKDLLGLKEEAVEIQLIGSLELEELTLPKDKLLSIALQGKFDVKALNQTRRLKEIQQRLTQASRLPTISAFLGYTATSGVDSATGANKYWGKDAWDDNLTGGINVQVPLSPFLPWSKESAQVKKGRLDLEDLDLQYNSLASSLELSIESTLLKLEEEKLKIASGRKNIELSQRLNDSAQEQYARGLISTIDLKDAQLGLNRARLEYIQTIYNYKTALFDLMDVVGVDHF